MARKRTFEPPRWALPRADRPAKAVKSAARILEVLEFIDDLCRPVNLAEVADALDIPYSSASALLHTLAELGYLHQNRANNTYLLACRTAMLGAKLASRMLRDGALFRMLRDIHESTSEYVVLATRLGPHAQYVYTMQATNPSTGLLYNGMLVPLPVCGAGIALLSACPDQDVWSMLGPLYADPGYRNSLMPLPELHTLLQRVREEGHVYFNNTLYGEGATLAMLLPETDHGHPVAVCIAGIASVLDKQKDALLVRMREAVDNYKAAGASAAARDGSG